MTTLLVAELIKRGLGAMWVYPISPQSVLVPHLDLPGHHDYHMIVVERTLSSAMANKV